jgi:two-component system, chemotaxis family, protein-glutamate methylesterase/glutaminase
VDALIKLAGGLPSTLGACVLVALHVSPDHPTFLHKILERSGPLSARLAAAGEPLETGSILVAPPGAHLTVGAGRSQLTHGAREGGACPSIDALFRSAAQDHGTRCVAVLLSGSLHDGTAGLQEVKRHAGVSVVQDPRDAQNPSMPLSAIEHALADYVAPVERVGSLVAELVAAQAQAHVGGRMETVA